MNNEIRFSNLPELRIAIDWARYKEALKQAKEQADSRKAGGVA